MEKPFIKICSMCQKEFPTVDAQVKAHENDIDFSHTYCPRHIMVLNRTIPGITPEQLAQKQAKYNQNKQNMVPDLAEHPELIKAYSHGIFTKEQAAQAQQQMALRENLKKRANIKY